MNVPYKVITISMYRDDLRRLDDLIDRLKKHGVKQPSRSAIIRHALSVLDENTIPTDMSPRGKS